MGGKVLRITDLSGIDAENFKERNRNFLLADDQPYEKRGHENRDELNHGISVVRNGDIRRVLDDFPRDYPLISQCAFWMHAVVGKHFFPDANHRTAIALLRELLTENGVQPGRWDPTLTAQVRDESHKVRNEIEPVRLDTLYEIDKLYYVWYRYFLLLLRDPQPLEE